MTDKISNPQQLVVLFVDICNSTELFLRLGNQNATREITRALGRMEDFIHGYDGRTHKRTGDGLMASFQDVDAACGAATTIQDSSRDPDLQVKIGFSYGRVFEVQGDQYGDAANVAARLADFAAPGEIIIEHMVYERLSDDLRADTSLLIETTLKGRNTPTKIYRVGWSREGTTRLPTAIRTRLKSPVAAVSDVTAQVILGEETYILDSKCRQLRVGRASDNDIVVEKSAKFTSGHHCTIFFSAGDLFVSDYSANGTFVRTPGSAINRLHRSRDQLSMEGWLGLGEKPGDSPQSTLYFKIRDSA